MRLLNSIDQPDGFSAPVSTLCHFFSRSTMYQALCLMLLSLLLLTAQLLTLVHAQPVQVSHMAHATPCLDSEQHCHTAAAADCCEDVDDCVLKCAQGSAWMGGPSALVTLAIVRALPPPVQQHLPDYLPDLPYQPPRLPGNA